MIRAAWTASELQSPTFTLQQKPPLQAQKATEGSEALGHGLTHIKRACSAQTPLPNLALSHDKPSQSTLSYKRKLTI